MRVLPLLLLCPTVLAQEPVHRRVALVIGVSSYPYLPPELGLDGARAEAARVAAVLEQGAGFDEVRLLTDASATSTGVLDVLRQDVSQSVQPGDLFLLYFVGHGLGADFGDPRLLFYDTRPDTLETTSLAVRDVATTLQQVRASSFVVVTDAAFPGALNGVGLFGPTGNDWPSLGRESFVVSSTAPRKHATPGAFSRVFVDALGGRADTNGDLVLTGSELNAWLVVSVPTATSGTQLPTVQATYAPGMELARRVAPPEVAGTGGRVDKAKFVFQGGTQAEVTCGSVHVACEPSCYLWDVPAGTCSVRMSVGAVTVEGSAAVLYPGAYTCGAYQGGVRCSSPPPPR